MTTAKTSKPESMRSFTDAAADAVARAIASVQREAQHERELRAAEHRAVMAEINARLLAVTELERQVNARLAELKDGKSVTVEDVTPLIVAECEKRFAELPIPEKGDKGEDADPELVTLLVDEKVREVVAALPAPELPEIPVPKDGKDADPEVIARMVEEAVAALPPAAPGKDADPEMVEALVDEKVRSAVAALPPPEKGDPGAPGKLPMARQWSDRVYREAECVAHCGGLYQAQRDTGKEPPHDDWICLASPGRPGKDADQIELKSTFDPEAEYKRLNIVALNGAAFMARKDDPGPCPGEGWQVIAMRGKPGKPGESIKGDRGSAATVSDMEISEDGRLTLTNADGTKVECDLYPLLSKVV